MTGFLIIGAGPAGLAAAEVLAAAGPVTVVERQAKAGGVPRLCGHSPFGLREFRRVMGGTAYASRLTEAATGAGAVILLNHSVMAIHPDLTVDVSGPDGLRQFHPDRILLATGAREASRAERLLPGDRPLGIVTTGALQDLWFARRSLPFRRPVIYGSELVAMSAILTCRQAGAQPLAVIEPGTTPLARAPFRWLPRVLSLPVHLETEIADVVARDGRLDHVILRNASGQTRRVDCDGLVLTGDFRPEIGLARVSGVEIDPATKGPIVDQSGRTTRPEIYCAGNLLRGIETAGACWAEGRAVARAMLADQGRPAAPAVPVVAGAGLRYVMPQRLSPTASPALPDLQIRVDHAGSGHLTLRDAVGQILTARRLSALPEQRISMALPNAAGPVTVSFEAG